MRSFTNIAELIRTKRMAHPQALSQSDLSDRLGYKNGQFISNVERGLCNVPLKMMSRIAEILDITPEEIKMAVLKDHKETLDNFFNTAHAVVTRNQKKALKEAQRNQAS